MGNRDVFGSLRLREDKHTELLGQLFSPCCEVWVELALIHLRELHFSGGCLNCQRHVGPVRVKRGCFGCRDAQQCLVLPSTLEVPDS